MRPSARLRAFRATAAATFAFAALLVLSACELPLAATPAMAQSTVAATPPASTSRVDAGSAGGSMAEVCDATDLSTILHAVPPPAGGTPPVDVRVHYHRPDGAYADWGLHVWQVDAKGDYLADHPGVTWDTPLPRSGTDDYGAVFEISASGFTHPAAAGFGFIVHPPGQGGDPGIDRLWSFADGGEFWLRSGDASIYPSNPLATTPDIATVRVHYRRYDGGYDQWGLHLWGTSGIDVARLPGLALGDWNNPVPLSAMPNYVAAPDGSEVAFDLPVLNPQGDAARTGVDFVLHGLPSNPNGGVNNKDGWNSDIRVTYASLSIADGSGSAWLVQDTPRVFTREPDLASASTTDARAVWLTRDTLRWPRTSAEGTFRLYHSATAQVVARKGQPVTGADGSIALQPGATVPAEAMERFRWVGAGVQLAVAPVDDAAVAEALRGQAVLVQLDDDGRVVAATTAQLAGALDDRHASAGALDDLGVTLARAQTRFRLWAPTAQRVSVCVYPARGGPAQSMHAMARDAQTGAWSATVPGRRTGQTYRYAVETFVRGTGIVRNLVTDPYALSLDTDSQRTWIGSLDDPAAKPAGWTGARGPARVQAQEDMSIYELHVRDFSRDDATVPAAMRGKYMGFTVAGSDGMRHLRALAAAGLTDVHLLPANDIASVPEAACVEPEIPEAAPDSDAQQAAVEAVRGSDCFNWGYDPWHYTAPEGSYSSDPSDGAVRVREFRAMVQALHAAGLRVGMDVVYNHTAAGGQDDRSVLDRIVPGYYHRLDAAGDITNSTCCSNTATENRMMEKLMVDSVRTWAVQYAIDGFRFDLMGHQPRAAMERLQAEVNAAVGQPVQLIGEGWNFGEVADGARFVQASQLSLNGSGIGTFSDRARDHVRGGSSGDAGDALRRNQGYVSGLFYDDNGTGRNATANDMMWSADVIKVGLAGSLRDYVLRTHWDADVALEDIDYNGQPAGYVTDPQEVVNYVENHDNQTLFDINAFRLPVGTSRGDRARVQMLAAAINAFSQGVAYWHAGVDTLRSKSLDRNSYDSGDWFNRIDWTGRVSHFGTGLPRQQDNGGNWPVMAPLLANPDIVPDRNSLRWTRETFRDLLAIRASSTLFRMRSADDVRARLDFRNTGSGQVRTVLAGHLDGYGYPGAGFSEVLYLVNVDKVAQSIVVPEDAGKSYRLHPVQRRGGADTRARQARYDRATGTFTVPARTAVVFVVR